MRRKHPTSHNKLSVVFVFLVTSFASIAKDEAEDTNIICFAAKNKWVCAPEDQQEIANEKANKLIGNNSEQEISEVIIKSINFPKFKSDVSPSIKTNYPIIQTVAEPSNNESLEVNLKKEKLSPNRNPNPYAELWSHQLIGVSTPQNAINYVKKNNLNKDEVLVIKSIRKGMDWWIVLYGLYKDKQTGLDNTPNLPKNIHDHWLRPLKNLQVNGFIEKF